MKTLDEYQAIQYFRQNDIPVVDTVLAKNVSSAVEAADRIGFPVVMKLSSPALIHKTEAGAVIVQIEDRAGIEESWDVLMKRAEKAGLRDVDVRGVLVQKMVRADAEFIIGGYRDPSFGATVMFGVGGVMTELYKDVAFRLAPIDIREAERLIDDTNAPRILEGYRSKKRLSRENLVKTLVQVSHILSEDESVAELDINPFVVVDRDGYALDALIKKSDKSE